MKAETQIACRVEEIRSAVTFIRGFLEKNKIRAKDCARAMLTVEESLRALIDHAAASEKAVRIRLDASHGNARIRLSSRGSAFEQSEVEKNLYFQDDPEANAVIERMVSRIFGNALTIRNRNGVNLCVIRVSVSRYRQLSLTVGAPGVPGGALVCTSLLLPQIGVPAEAISIIIGLYAVIGMMLTTVNVTGDATVSLLVAKSEKMLDPKIYNAKG